LDSAYQQRQTTLLTCKVLLINGGTSAGKHCKVAKTNKKEIGWAMKFIYCYNSLKTLNLQLTRITNFGKMKK
jgi:NAD+--asparagine ADP-ribosyltransferase